MSLNLNGNFQQRNESQSETKLLFNNFKAQQKLLKIPKLKQRQVQQIKSRRQSICQVYQLENKSPTIKESQEQESVNQDELEDDYIISTQQKLKYFSQRNSRRTSVARSRRDSVSSFGILDLSQDGRLNTSVQKQKFESQRSHKQLPGLNRSLLSQRNKIILDQQQSEEINKLKKERQSKKLEASMANLLKNVIFKSIEKQQET